MKKFTTDSIVHIFRKIHGDEYNYSLVEYDGVDVNVIIICSKHGEFKQTPYTHKTGSGCKKCHYKNYQLLPSYYNRHIKRGKPFNEKDFVNWLNNSK